MSLQKGDIVTGVPSAYRVTNHYCRMVVVSVDKLVRVEVISLDPRHELYSDKVYIGMHFEVPENVLVKTEGAITNCATTSGVQNKRWTKIET